MPVRLSVVRDNDIFLIAKNDFRKSFGHFSQFLFRVWNND